MKKQIKGIIKNAINVLYFVFLLIITIIFSIIIAGYKGDYINLPSFMSNNIAITILFILNIIICSLMVAYIICGIIDILTLTEHEKLVMFAILIICILLIATFIVLIHFDGFIINCISTFLESFFIGSIFIFVFCSFKALVMNIY